MSKIKYQKQSPSVLKYQFITKDLDYKFNVLENKQIRWQDLILDFSIIGSSHFVKIKTDSDNNIMELIACVESEDIALNTDQQIKLLDYPDFYYNINCCGNYNYSFFAEIFRERIGDYQEFQREYICDNIDEYMYYIFPSPDGLAITSIEIKQNHDRLLWITYHSYPEEKVIVKTRSILERRNGS